MNFHVYREITYDDPTRKPTYMLLGSTRYHDDAEAILDRWHAGYIITSAGMRTEEKNLTKKKSND